MSSIPQHCVDMSNWQAGFISILPKIETHAKIKFRRLSAVHREEAIAECIAAACVAYQRLAVQGKLHQAYASTLANYAVKHVRDGRHVGGHQDAAKDVLSATAQRRRGVRVVRCDIRDHQSGGWKDLAIAEGRVSVADTAAFRIDFAEWLGTLRSRDRRLVHELVAGEGTTEAADHFRVSPARISELRRKFEDGWHAFQGEVAEAA